MHLRRFIPAYRLMLVLITISAWSCAPTISLYDQHAYQETTSVKVDALDLMSQATDEYQAHAKEVQQLESQIQKIYEYEKNRPKNEITVRMWEKLKDKNEQLLGGFLQKWKMEERIAAAVVEGAKKNVGLAFDQIAQLEIQKIKKKY